MTTLIENRNRAGDVTKGKWFCMECGKAINKGYSWNGYCVVCSEKYLNPDYVKNDRG
jgi:hypothetical protein